MKIPENVTKEQLINDLIKLSQRIDELEKIEADKKAYEQELTKTKAWQCSTKLLGGEIKNE